MFKSKEEVPHALELEKPLIKGKKLYKGEARRWFVLFSCCLGSIAGNMVSATLAPLVIPITEAFGLSSVMYVNLTIIISAAGCIPM